MKTWFNRVAAEMQSRVQRRQRELGVAHLPDHEWRYLESQVRAEMPRPGERFPAHWDLHNGDPDRMIECS